MGFDAYDVALQILKLLRSVLAQLRQNDRSLTDQTQRAAQSMVLNVAEGRRRLGRDRKHLFSIALGSAAEVRAALEVACALGHVAADSVGEPLALLDREVAMLWRLSRG